MKADKKIGALLVETKALATGEQVYYFQATVGTKDREGEIVTVDGWDFENFLKNPVFMAIHDYEQWPIGKIIELEQNDLGFKIGVVFDDLDPEAVKVRGKYDRGFMNAVSVGFIRKETTGKRAGNDWVTSKKELLEVSAVPIPGHPDALMIRKGLEGLEEQVGIKAVDFATSLTLDQARSNLWDRKWTIERALERANDSVTDDAELTREEKIAAIATNYTQFQGAMLGWYGDYLTIKEVAAAAGVKMLGQDSKDIGEKAGRTISKKSADAIKAAIDHVDNCKSVLLAIIGDQEIEDEGTPCEACGMNCCSDCSGSGCDGSCCADCAGEKSAVGDGSKGTKEDTVEVAIKADLTALMAFVGNKEEK